LSMPRRHVESWTTLNLRAAFTLQAGGQWLADTSILLGVDNVLDTPPPFVNNGTIRIGYDQENGDLSGRIVSLRVRKKW
jgi:outer membrane receptor protein involved in Fe transport